MKKVMLLVFFFVTGLKGKIISDFNSYRQLPHEYKLINITHLNDQIEIDMRYATTNNFTHKKIYQNAQALLRKGTAEKLNKVAQELQLKGYRLKIWDAYRPYHYQEYIYFYAPNKKFVASPQQVSKHSRGAAVDVTLLSLDGNEVEMPTDFDDMSEKAHYSYKNLSETAIKNRNLLKNIMIKNGFIPLSFEWWHFNDKDWQLYDGLDIDFSDLENEIE